MVRREAIGNAWECMSRWRSLCLETDIRQGEFCLKVVHFIAALIQFRIGSARYGKLFAIRDE
jgi:hypothetical protein